MSASNECKLLKDLRVADLKLELEKRGQATSGVKAVLVERLQNLLKEEGKDPEIFDFNASANDQEVAIDASEQAETKDETTTGTEGEFCHDNRKEICFCSQRSFFIVDSFEIRVLMT